MTEGICPVCQKKVGSWYKSGMHPKCEEKAELETIDEFRKVKARGGDTLVAHPAMSIARMTQEQRDSILRRINRPR